MCVRTAPSGMTRESFYLSLLFYPVILIVFVTLYHSLIQTWSSLCLSYSSLSTTRLTTSSNTNRHGLDNRPPPSITGTSNLSSKYGKPSPQSREFLIKERPLPPLLPHYHLLLVHRVLPRSRTLRSRTIKAWSCQVGC